MTVRTTSISPRASKSRSVRNKRQKSRGLVRKLRNNESLLNPRSARNNALPLRRLLSKRTRFDHCILRISTN